MLRELDELVFGGLLDIDNLSGLRRHTDITYQFPATLEHGQQSLDLTEDIRSISTHTDPFHSTQRLFEVDDHNVETTVESVRQHLTSEHDLESDTQTVPRAQNGPDPDVIVRTR